MANLEYTDILKAQLDSNKLSHAYIFEAYDYEIGKIAALDFIAQIYEKEGKTVNLNNIDGSRNFKTIKPSGKTIKIEDIRQLIKFYQTLPFENKYKFAIVEQADRLRVESSNAMLKLLEDMPEYGKIILITKSSKMILSTIKSRCQVIKILSDIEMDEIIDTEFVYYLLDEFIMGNFHAIIQNNEKIEELKEYGHEFFSIVIEFLNSILILKYYSYNNGILSDDRIKKYKLIQLSEQKLIDIIEKCIDMQINLNNNVNFLLSIEELALILNK